MTFKASHDALGPRTSADALLESMERVRALAGRLVRQAADQDDLVQEAVLRALVKPNTIVGESGPWASRVLRNLAIDRQRSSARRQGRELSTLEGHMTQESTADSVARAESQRDLVDSVLKLPEPYRGVILARFFDGLPPREISKQLGVPVATVKKQQERGMALLRKDLEGRYGPNGAWAVALLPILPKPVLRSLAAKGVGAGTLAFAPRWIAMVAAILVGVVVPLYFSGGDIPSDLSSAPIPAMERPKVLAESGGESMTGGLESPPRRLVAVVVRGAAAGDVASDAGVLRTFTGRFVDESGAAIAGVIARCRTLRDGDGEETAFEGRLGRGSAAGVVFASLTAPLESPMVVDVSAEGFAPAVFRFRPDSGRVDATVDVGRQTLYRPADLNVRVVDGGGSVLYGWEMSYFYYGGGERLERGRVTADLTTGSARFHGIAAAEVEVMAEHASGLEIHRPRRSLHPGGENSIDLVYLGPDPSRRVGVAIDWPAMAKDANGAPVEVKLLDGDATVARATLSLGAEPVGFEDVAPGYYMLSVEDPRFDPVRAPVEPGRSQELELRGNARLFLVLRDADGGVLTEHSVEVEPSGGRVFYLGSSTPESMLGGLVPGQPFVVRAAVADGREAVHEVQALEPGETRVLDLTLGDGLTSVRVHVVRGGGRRPVAGAEVTLFDGALAVGSSLAAKKLAQGWTDEEGTAILDVATHEMGETVTALAVAGDHALGRVVEGEAVLVLRAQGAASVRVRGVPDGVAVVGPLPEGMALTLTWPGGVGREAGPFGPGLVFASQDDGRFLVEGAPEGPATIWLSFSDFNHTGFHHTGRGTSLGAVTGPVGFPVGSIHVRADATVETDVDLGAVWPGRLEVVVTQAGRILTDAVVELEPAGSHGDLPYPFGAEVDVARTLSQLTDGSGRALFERVPKGTWRVRVRDMEWLWVTGAGEVHVEGSQRARVEVAVELTEALVTVVGSASGEPLRNGAILVEIAPHRRVRRVTDAQGRLRLRLGPGSYPVFLEGDSTRTRGQLEWGPDGPLRQELPLLE